jgi:hypothetical protein
VDRLQLGHRPAGGAGRHDVEPHQQELGRQVQHASDDPAAQAGHQATGQPPHHDRAGRRRRQQVGGQRDERHATERGRQQRRHRRLGGQGHRQGGREPPRPGQSAFEAAGRNDDAGGAGDRQPEAERCRQQRVDEDHACHPEGQGATRGRRPAEGPARRGHPGHGDGPQHRRLRPRHDREPGEHGQRAREARAEPQARQHRCGDRQDERDVLPAHGQQVREPGRPEGRRHVRGLLPVVPQGQAGEQCPLALGQAVGTAGQRAPQVVGGAGDGAARPPVGHGVDDQPARQMAVALAAFVTARPLDRTDDGHPLARQPVVERRGGRRPGEGAQPPPAQPDVDGHAASPRRARVADECDLGAHGAGRERRLEPVDRPLAERDRQQRGGEAEQHRRRRPRPRRDGDGEHADRGAREERDPAEVPVRRGQGGGSHHGRQHHRRPVAHRALRPWPGRGAARAWPRRCRGRR